MEQLIHLQDSKAPRTAPRKELGAREEWLAEQVVEAAVKVHRALGPGLLEGVYEKCLAHELGLRGIAVRSQLIVPIVYEGLLLESGLRLDLLVDGLVVLELKAVEKILPVHDAQILSYLKLAGLHLGFILNFNVPLIRDGIHRKVI